MIDYDKIFENDVVNPLYNDDVNPLYNGDMPMYKITEKDNSNVFDIEIAKSRLDASNIQELKSLAKQLFPDAIGNALVEGEMETIDVVVKDVKQETMDKETAIFIDKFNLLDLDSDASRFIDSIAANTGDKREVVIKQAAKDYEKFDLNLKKWVDKISKKSVKEV